MDFRDIYNPNLIDTVSIAYSLEDLFADVVTGSRSELLDSKNLNRVIRNIFHWVTLPGRVSSEKLGVAYEFLDIATIEFTGEDGQVNALREMIVAKIIEYRLTDAGRELILNFLRRYYYDS